VKSAFVVAVVVFVGGLAFAAAGVAVADNNPCHVSHTCPSDDHSYTWAGMSCTSHEDQRLPEDQIPVDWQGVRYWCHVVTDTGMGGGGSPPKSQPSCKSDRAAVATLRDDAASRLRLNAVTRTVRQLQSMQLGGSTSARRGFGPERTLYRLRARVLAARLENRSEWLVTLGDLSTGATVVVGFPAPICTAGAPSTLRGRMASARTALVQACGLARVDSQVRLDGTATLEGVGFVPSRGSAGASGVHLALRPVLAFSSGSCRRAG